MVPERGATQPVRVSSPAERPGRRTGRGGPQRTRGGGDSLASAPDGHASRACCGLAASVGAAGGRAKTATEFLKGAGLHGHKYAIDATMADVELRQPRPVALLTSDSDGTTKLCGNHVRIISL